MKKYLLVSLLALGALTSCQQDQTVEEMADSSFTFNALVDGSTTRSSSQKLDVISLWKNELVYPINWNTTPSFAITDLLSTYFVGAIPIAKRLSIVTQIYAGIDLLDGLYSLPGIMARYGYNYSSRQFYPQIAGVYDYGSYEAAAQLSLQYRPWKNLTIFGGQVFFNVFGTVGKVWPNFDAVKNSTFDELQWNTGLGAALRIKEDFVIYLRTGAGTTGSEIRPFLSIDIGVFSFSHDY